VLGLENQTPYEQLPLFAFFKEIDSLEKESNSKFRKEKKLIEDEMNSID